MKLSDLLNHVTDKSRFSSIENYLFFCACYLEYIQRVLGSKHAIMAF